MTGICACGHVKLTLSEPPSMLGVCHCTNCKRRTGSAFGISAYFAKSAVTAQEGETATYSFWHEAQQHQQERHFCVRCGTTLFWFVSTLPEQIGVAGGCLMDEGQGDSEDLTPTYSVNDRQRAPWVQLPNSWKVWP